MNVLLDAICDQSIPENIIIMTGAPHQLSIESKIPIVYNLAKHVVLCICGLELEEMVPV